MNIIGYTLYGILFLMFLPFLFVIYLSFALMSVILVPFINLCIASEVKAIESRKSGFLADLERLK